MTDLAPKKSPQRKAKVLGKARKRIISTDLKVERTEQALRGSRQATQNWAELFSSPIMQEMGEHVQRDLAHHLAEGISEKLTDLVSSDPELMDILIHHGLDKLVRETGDNMAAYLRDVIVSKAEAHAEANKVLSHGPEQTELYVQVKLPETRFTSCIMLPRRAY